MTIGAGPEGFKGILMQVRKVSHATANDGGSTPVGSFSIPSVPETVATNCSADQVRLHINKQPR